MRLPFKSMKSKSPLTEKTKANKQRSIPVAFRLEADLGQVLLDRAKVHDLSHHVLARNYVKEILAESEERIALRQAVNKLHQEIAKLRGDVALSVEALLASAGKVSEKDAHVWAEKCFGRT